MSLRTLPIFFFNLGGEMIYILDQRLRAQNVNDSKSSKVVQDIVGQMFDPKCIRELFRPQRAFSIKSLRVVFGKLAHSSIMKLNESAMDKLCDLMVMALKYQLLMCRRGEDIILITLNHLDTIRKLVGDSERHFGLIDFAAKTLTEAYSQLTAAEFILLRNTLLTVFQDVHRRVSIFLKHESQDSSGRFHIPVGGPVPNGFDIPGTIRYYNRQGDVESETKFEMPLKYELPDPPGSWALHGDRVTSLGTNIFAEQTSQSREALPSPKEEKGEKSSEVEEEEVKNELVVTAELKILEKMLGSIQSPPSGDTFKLKLFDDDEDEDDTTAATKSRQNINVLTINAAKRDDMLEKIAKDFEVEQSPGRAQDDDLLALMDSTN